MPIDDAANKRKESRWEKNDAPETEDFGCYQIAPAVPP
jgi:hypothetical protein